MKIISLVPLVLVFQCTTISAQTTGSISATSEPYVENPPPNPPVYPPRWTATAHFQFINMTSKKPAGSGILYQIIDSPNQKFRADDLYFAGTFPSPYDTVFTSSEPSNTYQYYANVTSDGVFCITYPGKPTTLSQNWVKDFCLYNLTLYYGTTKAYRWNCATDVVFWFIDTAADDGRLIYQHTLPQPFFDVYQYLWFTNYTVVAEEFDPAIFVPPKGWNCERRQTSGVVKYTFCATLLFISVLFFVLENMDG
ncbi:unnamed protein product [Adineta ricciae]|uniref:Uncharacterized protein n=1 Tax=Adineta ricciae TaxID=249248 RepID=A0A815N066_ADIRI|nr:unnamed protein product [Adineta ricciae]CAF1425315.1 unnamed protein product [Adineta ricciae]